jgi:adenosylhomocysteine nucleosidase
VETALLERTLTGRLERRIQGVRFVTGALYGRRVVLAESGIGKVNAAMTTTLLIDHFQPRAVLFTGIAGGINPDLAPGDLVIGQRPSSMTSAR